MPRPLITLLTDFGLRDHYVAAMKGVILGISPEVRLIDISHEIAPYSIQDAGWTLSQAWNCFPAGTIHLVVIDPGVGGARRPVLAEAKGHYFVGPDNGVFSAVLETVPDHKVFALTEPRYFRHPVSATFQGRDIFAPVAAHLSLGIAPEEFGPPIGDLLLVPAARPSGGDGIWTGTVSRIDRFGNIVTNYDWETFHWIAEKPFVLEIEGVSVSRFQSTYEGAPQDEIFVLRGSGGLLEISMNRGDAARELKARAGVRLIVRS